MFLRSITNDICSVSHLLFLDSNEIEWRANGEGYEKCDRLSSKSEIKSHQVLLRLNGLRYAIHSNVLGLYFWVMKEQFSLWTYSFTLFCCAKCSLLYWCMFTFLEAVYIGKTTFFWQKSIYLCRRLTWNSSLIWLELVWGSSLLML